MRKNFFVLVLSFMAVLATAQESVQFRTQVAPNKKYTTEVVNSSVSEVHIIADQETMDRISANGLELPMIMEQATELSITSTTGDPLESGELPVEMQYGKFITKTIVNGKSTIEEKPFSGMKILGRYNPQNTFVVDTIIGENVTQQMRDVLVATLANIQEQIKFPEQPMKIGDTFTSEFPLTIPMEGMNPIYVKLHIEYLLNNIKEGMAYFDLAQTITLDFGQEQLNVEASGTGNGTSEYDISEHQLVKFKSELPMDIVVKMSDTFTMKMKSTTKTDYRVLIE